MTEPRIQLDQLSEQNLQLMQAYSLRTKAARASAEEFDGWLQRIDDLPELSKEVLTRLHGELIALGYLRFEISGRHVGLRYQISTQGRQALERAEQRLDREASAETGSTVSEAA